MAVPKHNKYCTHKKSVCICPEINKALTDLQAKHDEQLKAVRWMRHEEAIKNYRYSLIQAFEDLIDQRFQVKQEPCSCSEENWRRY